MSKQIFRLCGTEAKMKQWEYIETGLCPLCNESEDNNHVLLCKSSVVNDTRDVAMNALEESLLDNNTPVNIV